MKRSDIGGLMSEVGGRRTEVRRERVSGVGASLCELRPHRQVSRSRIQDARQAPFDGAPFDKLRTSRTGGLTG